MLTAFLFAFALQTIDLEIEGKTLVVEIADKPRTRWQGLSGRKELPDGCGMLFVFETPQPLYFSMRQTKIPLSIGFFDHEKTLLNIEEMDPSSPCTFESRHLAQYALEVPKGWFEKNGIQVGAKFSFRKNASQVE